MCGGGISGIGNVVDHVGEAWVDATEEVEDKMRLRYGMPAIVMHIGHGLNGLTIFGDELVTCSHGMKFMIEEDGPRLLDGAEESFD